MGGNSSSITTSKESVFLPSKVTLLMNKFDAIEKEITLIAAISSNNVLGKDNKLIWHISADLKRFKRLTSGHCVIMGRKTFESLPYALPKRTNIVLTRNRNYIAKGALVVHSVAEALANTDEDLQPFILGGGEIYTLFLPLAHKIELTQIHHEFEGDAFFPLIDFSVWELLSKEDHFRQAEQPYNYSFLTYRKANK